MANRSPVSCCLPQAQTIHIHNNHNFKTNGKHIQMKQLVAIMVRIDRRIVWFLIKSKAKCKNCAYLSGSNRSSKCVIQKLVRPPYAELCCLLIGGAHNPRSLPVLCNNSGWRIYSDLYFHHSPVSCPSFASRLIDVEEISVRE